MRHDRRAGDRCRSVPVPTQSGEKYAGAAGGESRFGSNTLIEQGNMRRHEPAQVTVSGACFVDETSAGWIEFVKIVMREAWGVAQCGVASGWGTRGAFGRPFCH